MSKEPEKYHVLKCIENYACEFIGTFDSKVEARQVRVETQSEISDHSYLVIIVPTSLLNVGDEPTG